ncbi:hypothetical protein [Leptolyngbya sp. FACHB-541]|uniref:hypothetical protein n=1 Tax=Leptolyngbya sp. FACHB-541 TaxID=2692810 RepID=UPI001681D551|nr:hypothetical protein [Leptolyngbya sp. FACHB-541]
MISICSALVAPNPRLAARRICSKSQMELFETELVVPSDRKMAMPTASTANHRFPLMPMKLT